MEQQTVEMITQMVLQTISRMEEKSNGYQVPVGVSARHIHLTQEHVETLFGEGYHLTKKKDLMGGQYACNETVTVVGLKLRAIENVRVLGPVRKASQLEISATDAMKLGVAALIDMQFLGSAYNPNLGSAVSLVLMVIILICMGIMNQFDDGEANERGGMLL